MNTILKNACFLVTAVAIFSCGNGKKLPQSGYLMKTSDDTKYYQDFDFFSFTPVKEVSKELKYAPYPVVEVIYKGDKIQRVQYFLNKNTSTTREFAPSGKSYVISEALPPDVYGSKSKTFFKKDSIITWVERFKLEDTTQVFLSAITVLVPQKETTYFLPEDNTLPYIIGDENMDKYLIESIDRKFIQYDMINDSLIKETVIEDYKSNDYSDTIVKTFNVPHRSFFWWYTFRNTFKPI